MPKIFYTNTAAEYWRGDTSLMHTDMAGTRDVEPSADSRIYLFASTQHVAGSLPLVDGNGPGEPRGRYVANAVDYAPLMRAALINLDRWIVEGTEPPASVFPRLADGTAITGAEVIAAFRQIPGLDLPDPAQLPVIRRVDLGPDAARGIGRYPTEPGERYPNYVAAVDADGNERVGIRMPDVAVPLATYTGWNPRHPETGGAAQILPMQGSTLPFARTADERAQTGDPRPSIAERYRDRADYLDQVRHAALSLVEQRYLLPEDVSTRGRDRCGAVRLSHIARVQQASAICLSRWMESAHISPYCLMQRKVHLSHTLPIAISRQPTDFEAHPALPYLFTCASKCCIRSYPGDVIHQQKAAQRTITLRRSAWDVIAFGAGMEHAANVGRERRGLIRSLRGYETDYWLPNVPGREVCQWLSRWMQRLTRFGKRCRRP